MLWSFRVLSIHWNLKRLETKRSLFPVKQTGEFWFVMPYSDSDTWRVDDSSHLNFYEKGHFVRLSWCRGSNVNWYIIALCLIFIENNYPECWINCLLICSLFFSCHLSSGPFQFESITSGGKGASSLTTSTSWKIDHYCIGSSVSNEWDKNFIFVCVCECVN